MRIGGLTQSKLAPIWRTKKNARGLKESLFGQLTPFGALEPQTRARQDRYFLTRSTISSRILPVHLIITLLDIVTTIWRITKNANPD